ncbi:MAG: hypothetical protein AAB535_03885 [Patescibacteria group bacterium]
MPIIPNLSPELIKKYQDEIALTHSSSTAKRKSISLNRFFDWATSVGHMTQNPIQKVSNEVKVSQVPKTIALSGMSVGMAILVFALAWKTQFPIKFITNLASVGIPESSIQTRPVVEPPRPEATPEPTPEETLLPAIGGANNLIFAGNAPIIDASIGDLLIEGKTVTVKTTDGADGNIEINPDGFGIAHFLFEGTGKNFLNAQAPNLTSGSLYYGVVANNAVGYDLLRLQSGSKPTTKFSIDAVGNTLVGKDLNVKEDIATNGIDRLTTTGALKNITGYSQNSGNFTINQNLGDFASITKKGPALSDVLNLTLDERGAANASTYSALTLKRYNGIDDIALFVDEGNARFDGQVQIGRFTSNPSSIGQGSLVFNTSDNTGYVWNGSSWVAFAGSGTNADTLDSLDSTQFLRSDTSDNFTSGTLTTDAGTTLDVNGDLTIADTNIAFDGATTTFTTTGDLTIDSGGGQILFSDTDTLNIGGLTNTAYNAFANAADTPAVTAAITTDNDLFVGGDIELKGGFYLTGHNIYNVISGTGTATIALATNPTGPGASGDYNSLTYGAWLVQNTTNNGIAALMVDQTKGGDIFTASSSGTTKFVIQNDGDIGIGTSAPTTGKLVIAQTDAANLEALYIDTEEPTTTQSVFSIESDTTNGSGADTVKFKITADGSVYSDSNTYSTPADLAEMYYTVNDVGVGDVVEVTSLTTGDPNLPFYLQRSQQNSGNSIIGVVSTNPGSVMGYDWNNMEKLNRQKPVALSGRVPVKISPSSPAIDIGDPIAPSTDPGKGKKATKSGVVVGKALESWTPGSGKDSVLVFINLSSYDPGFYPTVIDQFEIMADGLINQAGEIVDQIGAFAQIIALNIRAGAIEAQNLESRFIKTSLISPIPGDDLAIELPQDSRFKIQDSNKTEVASIDNYGNATFSGEIRAREIHSENLDEIEALLAQVQVDQSVLLAATASASPTASDSAEFAQLILSNLFVINHAAISSLLVNETLTTQNLDSLTEPLRIQSLAAAPVEIMAGLIKIDIMGNMQIAGNLEVAGKITAPEADFAKLSVENLVIANPATSATSGEPGITPEVSLPEVLAGNITTNSTVGKGIIPAEADQITITNPKITDYTLVYITPTSSTQNKVLYIKEKSVGYFVAGFTDPIDTDTEFNWWIIETK